MPTEELPDWLLNPNPARTVSAILPATLVQLLNDAGLDPQPLLTQAGISAQQLLSLEQNIPLNNYSKFCHLLQQAQAGSASALWFGQHINLASLGEVGQLLLASKTLAQAIDVGCKYMHLLGIPLHGKLKRQAGVAKVIFNAPLKRIMPSSMYLPMVATLYSAWLNVFNIHLARPFSFSHVSFSTPEPSDIDQFHTFFACPISFNQKHDSLSFASDYLEEQLPSYIPGETAHIQQRCEQILAEHTLPANVLERVIQFIISQLPRAVSLKETASQLNLSTRTMTRNLAEHGLNFRFVNDEIRKFRAQRLIESRQYSMEQVAQQTGYSELANFRRAFKKWTGVAPKEWQNKCCET